VSASLRDALLVPLEVAGRNAVAPFVGLQDPLETLTRRFVARFPTLRAPADRLLGRSIRRIDPITLEELREGIRALDVRGTLLVHSSWDAIRRRVAAKPSAVLDVIRDVAGPDGTVVMPTNPFEGIYDPARSPSYTGLLTECLRRTPGAVRSPHPVAPACAIGGWAADCARDFREEAGRTAFGRGSPYWRVAQEEGHVIFLGIDEARVSRINSLMHVAFDVLGDDNPIANYYEEGSCSLVFHGKQEEWSLRFINEDNERFHASENFKRAMTSAGLLRFGAVRGLPLAAIPAGLFFRWHLALARAKGVPYWGFRRRRGGRRVL
jgi:aminoglycoside N3'-acetyltransferase